MSTNANPEREPVASSPPGAETSSALAVSERLAVAMLQATRDQARDATLLQGVVAQGVALLQAAARGDAEATQRGEEVLRSTLEIVAKPNPEKSS